MSKRDSFFQRASDLDDVAGWTLHGAEPHFPDHCVDIVWYCMITVSQAESDGKCAAVYRAGNVLASHVANETGVQTYVIAEDKPDARRHAVRFAESQGR